MALNLEKQLVFYGAYHHEPVNVWIHIVCVPAILMTTYLGLTVTGPLIPVPSSLAVPYLPTNLGTIGAFLYSTLYILMEPVAGGLLAPLIIGGTAAMNWAVDTYGADAYKIGGAIFVVSWIAQFIGHGKFEGRAPALLDNLVQALFLAPLFVWLEILFMLGYRPELRSRIDRDIAVEIAKFRAQDSASKKQPKTKSLANGHGNGKASS